MAELVAGPDGDDPTPLVIVIDELDRCRPDYALEVLEVIKHFFAVPMVHFVLGVNLIALANSVKARYGQEIDATAYLQKFISLTLVLPDRIGNQHMEVPAVVAYAEHTAEAMELPAEYVEEIVVRQLPGVARCNFISIRDVGKILGAVAILPSEAVNPNLYPGWRSITASMIIARVVRKDIFDKMLDSTLSENDLAAYIDATPATISRQLPDGEHNQDYHHPTWCMYWLWKFILSNGASRSDDWKDIGRQFSQFGDRGHVKRIPKTIFDDWLSMFEAPDIAKER